MIFCCCGGLIYKFCGCSGSVGGGGSSGGVVVVVVRLAKTGGETSDETGDETGDTDKDLWQDWWLDLPLLTLPLCTVGWFGKIQKPIFFKPQKLLQSSEI